jgi:hypothetical protein
MQTLDCILIVIDNEDNLRVHPEFPCVLPLSSHRHESSGGSRRKTTRLLNAASFLAE